MPTALEQELYRAAARTFEDLAFLLPVPTDDGRVPEAEVWAAVDFRGPFSGRLAVGCSRDTLQALAMNMLGEDEVPVESQQMDALGEVANVVCGNLLPAIAGTRATFRMDAPRLLGRTMPDGDQPHVSTRLELSEGWAHILLFMDGSTPGQATLA